VSEERFADLWATYGPRVLAYALRHVDPDSAQDALSETFLVAWRRLSDVPANPLPWLLVVARNTIGCSLPAFHVRLFRARQRLREGLDAGVVDAHVAVLALGGGIAAAGGLLPDSLTGPLKFWTHETGGRVDVQHAHRVAQEPGPDGQVLSVWSARAADGTTCIAPMFETPGPLDRPAPAHFELAGGQCLPPASTASFGDLGASSDRRNLVTAWATAGSAVQAELHFPDGSTRAALPAEGMFFLWYTSDEEPALVGYDAAGRVVGTVRLPG